jgi:serine/threonine protein kinase/tetratricopeptide (TPR) repeat protein
MSNPLMPGSQLLHYRLVRKIGEGGMGVVYEAEDIRLGRTVAIKLLQPSISENPEVKLRFLREARAASALDHPNLCTIYTVEEMPDGSFLLVMACYRGQTVAELLQTSGALDAARIRDIGRQTAAGLHAAHMAGIVHRDIKPGNIFLLHSGTVKILDFGLSHIVDQQQLTVPHQVMGTLAYMPPEQLAGLAIDHRADIWALGAVLYEMAAGHSPFHHPTPAATMSAITECRYIPLHQIRPELPKSIFLAVERALCLELHQRHSSAADFLNVLDQEIAVSAAGTAASVSLVAPTVMSFSSASSAYSLPTELTIPHSGTLSLRHGSPQTVSSPDPNAGLSIAVLPLRNVSSDPENEYFSDGLTDELISALGTLSGLRVVSRTSAFSFKGTTRNIREIGDALDVQVILEGSVRRSGARVRVTIQLTQVRQGFHLWSSRFDGDMSDVFGLQDEIASSVVSALRNKLSLDLDVSDLQVRTPMQADAYEEYLKGRYHWNRKTPEDIQLAGRYFEHALKLNSKSAAAHAGVADFYCFQGMLGLMPPHEAWAQARSSALRAIALDPDLPEGHLALASVLQFYDWDWEGARQHMVKAVQLRPQRGESYYLYAAYLTSQGLLQDALEQCRIGLTYDPLSTPLLAAEALIRAYLGDHDTSILLAQSALKSAPHYFELYYALGIAQVLTGRTHEAVQTFKRGIEHSRMPVLMGWLAEAHVQNGSREEARTSLDHLLELAEKGNPMPLPIAVAAASLGDNELALNWLETAAEQHDILVAYIGVFPSLRKLHNEPRYRSLLDRMKLTHSLTQGRRHVAR